MNACLGFFRVFAGFIMVALIASCSTSSVDQGLGPQPTITQVPLETQPAGSEVAATELNQQTDPNALASQTAENPTQNVTESQLQQQNGSQIQSTGLVDPGAPVGAPSATQEVASLDLSNAMTFLPFEGAPATKTASLTRLLNSSAQSNGLTILSATRTGAKYKVKGYFSALNDGTGTMLVYVWDVVDGSGKRLHRINGRERTGKTRTDPWQAITDEEMQRVASATTSRLKSWVDKR